MTLFLTSDESNIDGENTRSSFKNWILPDFFEKEGFNLKLHEIFFDTKFPSLANFNFPHIITTIIGKEHRLQDFPTQFQNNSIFKQLFNNFENHEYSPLIVDLSLCTDSFLSHIDFKVFYEIHPRLNFAFSIAFIKDITFDSQNDVVNLLNGSMFPFHKKKPLQLMENGYVGIKSNLNMYISQNLLNLLGFVSFDSEMSPSNIYLPLENEYIGGNFVEDPKTNYKDMLERMEEESPIYENYRLLINQKPKASVKVEFDIGSYSHQFEIEYEIDLFHQREQVFNYDTELDSINYLLLNKYLKTLEENILNPQTLTPPILQLPQLPTSPTETDLKDLEDLMKYLKDRTAIQGLEKWGGLFTLKREKNKVVLEIFHTESNKNKFKEFHKNLTQLPNRLIKQFSNDIFVSSKLKTVSFNPTLCHMLGLSKSSTSPISISIENEEPKTFPFTLNYYKSARLELMKYLSESTSFALKLVESQEDISIDSIKCIKTNHKSIYMFKKDIPFFADEPINLKLNSPKLIFVMANFVQHSCCGSYQKQILNFFPLPKKLNTKVHYVFQKPIILKTLPGSVFHINLVDEDFNQIKADVGKPTLLVLKKSFEENMFPVTLISSDKFNLELYPENRANSFKNKLSFPLLFNQKDKWGVILRSLAYPRVMNIFSKYCYLKVVKSNGELVTIALDDCYVTGGTKLVYLLNKKIHDILSPISDSSLPKFSLKHGLILFETNDFECFFNGDMIKMLGLTHSYQEDGISFPPHTDISAVMELNMYLHQPQEMIIITNIVEESFYAQSRPKVLKIVPIPTDQMEFNAYNHIQFDDEDFVPLKLKRIDDIQISILTRKGDLIKFIENDVKCQLEFKQLI